MYAFIILETNDNMPKASFLSILLGLFVPFFIS